MKPWSQSQFEATRIIDDQGNHVCDTYEVSDAHLIAAAPDMLEALEAIQADSSGAPKKCGHDFTCVCAWDAVNNAIKKARGTP